MDILLLRHGFALRPVCCRKQWSEFESLAIGKLSQPGVVVVSLSSLCVTACGRAFSY